MAAGLLAAPGYLVLITVLGALEPGFSHRTSLMSVLGGVPGVRGTLFNVGVAATGSLVIAFGVGLGRQLHTSGPARAGVGLLLVGGLGMIGAGLFHCNEGCRNILAESDLVGRLHIVTSLLAGMGTGLAPLFLWAAMRRSARWTRTAGPTLVAAILANLTGVTFWVTLAAGLRLTSVEGLIQRAGLVVVLLWMLFVAVSVQRGQVKQRSR